MLFQFNPFSSFDPSKFTGGFNIDSISNIQSWIQENQLLLVICAALVIWFFIALEMARRMASG